MSDGLTSNEWVVLEEDRVMVCDGEYGNVIAEINHEVFGLETALAIAHKMAASERMLAALHRAFRDTDQGVISGRTLAIIQKAIWQAEGRHEVVDDDGHHPVGSAVHPA